MRIGRYRPNKLIQMLCIELFLELRLWNIFGLVLYYDLFHIVCCCRLFFALVSLLGVFGCHVSRAVLFGPSPFLKNIVVEVWNFVIFKTFSDKHLRSIYD